MKFLEGMLVGSIITFGATVIYNNNFTKNDTKKMVKKGKQFAKKLGLI